MRTIIIAICLLCFGWMKSYSQAWVWEKPINTTKNAIATDPNHNIIVLSKNGNATQLSKFTKNGALIWSKLLKKAGSFTPSGTVVADKTGNIYTFTEGFDSVNSVFTGIKTRGITKFDPQGNALWHVPYDDNQYPLSADTKLPIQLDESNNVYVGYSVTLPSALVTVRLGNLTTAVIASNAYLAIGSISPNGTPRWVRAFRFNQQPPIGLTSATGFSVAGNKIFISGSMGKYYLYLDNGLNLFADRCTAWLAVFNCSNGQSLWGKVHQLIYYCNGTICSCSNPYVMANPVAGKVALTNNLNGAFEFQPLDTIASIMNFGLPAVKTYYTIYDTLGNPVKGKTIDNVPNLGQYNEILAGSRNNFFFVHFSNSNPTPGFGDTLRKVDTGFNLIWQVTLPPAMEKIFIPQNSNDIIATYTRAGVVYLAKMVDSAAVISGRTYADWNNDGVYTSADSALSNILITSNSSLVNSISGNDTGKYYMYAAPGTYTLNANFNHPYYEFLPATHTATITLLSDSVKGKDFRLRPLFPFTDVSVSFSALSVARPGSNTLYNVTAKNTGATTTSIEVGLKLPPLTSYNSISGGTVTVNAPDSITIAMGSVDPFATKTAILSLNIATTATINDTLRYFSKAYPYITDTIKQDNTDTLIQAVRTSFDPNEKEVNLAGQPLADTSKYLVYTIHFQNSGNATAFYVRIADTLSLKLNPNTFNFIDASHPVSTEIKGNIINFIFNPITLPDSIINEQQSHGFVKFKIKPVTPFNAADTIFNKAAIYFDYNTPVITGNIRSWYFTGPVVPVLLKSFVAIKKSTSVLLKFVTSTEDDLKYFIIERSTDGINFIPIGAVQHQGSNATGASYVFEDFSPANDINFYRLKMVDIDQKFTYSWTVAVKFSDNELPTIKVFPNPATGNMYIILRNMNTQKMISCKLSDAGGKTVWATNIDVSLRDTYTINTSSLPNGVYFLTATNKDINHRQKIIVKH